VRVFGLATVAAVAPALAAASPAGANQNNANTGAFVQHNLVSDVKGMATLTDASLVNPWGLAQGGATPIWVADNGTNVATLYTGDGVGAAPMKVGLTVSIPGDGPTGQVFNGSATDFVVKDKAGDSGAGLFLFDSESGDVTGWNPAVPPPQFSTQAQNGAHVNHAVYKGLALASANNASHLYAANFHAGRIDVFDSTFTRTHLQGSFKDPDLPKDYAPFDIAALNGKLYVTYAVQDAKKHDEVDGLGLGLIDVFDTSGHFVKRLVSHGLLNAPWGMAMAPAGFGNLGGDLLVGNFGDGRIHAYDPNTGQFKGTVHDANGKPITIDGLWGLMFGNGTTAAKTSLMFSAGIDHENHGLFGSITPAAG
jgi:uncharacterized protein (TIGR03118 family)